MSLAFLRNSLFRKKEEKKKKKMYQSLKSSLCVTAFNAYVIEKT